MAAEIFNFMFGQFIFDNTHTQSHTHLSKCNSSLASAEIEIGNKPRFFLSGKLGRARLTDLFVKQTLPLKD